MRILLDARYLDGTFSGIGTYSYHLLQHLAHVDQENEYFVLVRPGFNGGIDAGENFKFLSYRPAPVSFRTLFNLGSYVDGLGVDLMHSFFPLAPLDMRTPLVITMHDLQPLLDPDFSGGRPWALHWAYNAFYRYVYPAAIRRAKWVVTVSYHTRDVVVELFPEAVPKLIVVTSGLEESLFTPPEEDAEQVLAKHGLHHPYLLYYGSTRPNKNLPMAVHGFAEYLREHGDAVTELIMILKKDRFFKEIKKALRNEGIEDRVRVMDQVTNDDKRAILSRARMFLFPTKHEGFGFPPLEAMAAGVPVLAGDSGALPEICGEAAEFVNPDDPQSIAEGIATLMKNQERRRILIEKGHARAKQFDWMEAAEKVRDIYRLLF